MKRLLAIGLLLCISVNAFGMRVSGVQKVGRQSLISLIQKRNIGLNKEIDLPELVKRFGTPECFELLRLFEGSNDLRSIRNHLSGVSCDRWNEGLVDFQRKVMRVNEDKWLADIQWRYLNELIHKADAKEHKMAMNQRWGGTHSSD